MKGAMTPYLLEIEQRIFLLRGLRVMLSIDLASIYGVEPRVLVPAVKRNIERFPEDFMFQLSEEEAASLRSQFVTLKQGRGQHSKYLPYAFTEQGVAMLSGILNSQQAIKANIEIMRAFVRQRQILASNRALAEKVNALEKKYDSQFKIVFDAIRQIMTPPESKKRPIGFGRE